MSENKGRSLGYKFFKSAKSGKLSRRKPIRTESPEKAKQRALAVKMAREAAGK